MLQMQSLLIGLNNQISTLTTSDIKIGVGVSKGTFYINRIEGLKSVKTPIVTALSVCSGCPLIQISCYPEK